METHVVEQSIPRHLYVKQDNNVKWKNNVFYSYVCIHKYVEKGLER